MKEEKITVAFFRVPLKVKYEALADAFDEHPLVHDALEQYLSDFPKEIEIWHIEKNIAATEVGYIIAMEQTPDIEKLIEENEIKSV